MESQAAKVQSFPTEIPFLHDLGGLVTGTEEHRPRLQVVVGNDGGAAVWVVALAAVIIWVERRRSLRPGQVFAMYVMGYPIGRGLIELMRTDDANRILGLRLNVWTSALVFALGVFLFRRAARRHDPDSESHDVI